MSTRGVLEGRRVALIAVDGADAIRQSVEGAGGAADVLRGDEADDQAWHGGRYAALVVADDRAVDNPRAVQLVREFLVSGKPIAVRGSGLRLVEKAGGAREDVIVADGGESIGQPAGVVQALATRLDDDRLDEMSDLSFPASDPPAITPASIGADGRPPTDRRT